MSALFDLAGKAALVTGASRGLGEQMALALARAGADVAVTSRDVARLDSVCGQVEALGRAALPLEVDVCDLGSIRAGVAAALERFGALDVLVANAGLNVRKRSLEITWDEWNLVLDTNLRGAFFTVQAVAPSMIERGRGRIVTVGSLTSLFGFPAVAPYGASRGGIRQLTMSLAAEWAQHGVTVNCIAPGYFRTGQTESLYRDPAWVASIEERVPLGRTGLPGDLDGAVVFLASDASAYVTGQMLVVDGGFATGSVVAPSEG